jgi:DNA helicase IV
MQEACPLNPAIAQEQVHLDAVHRRLDAITAQVEGRLRASLAQERGTAQSLVERDAAVAGWSDQLARLAGAGEAPMFGRLDLDDGGTLHIGRIGLRGGSTGAADSADSGGPADPDSGSDSGDVDDEPLLVDWRAPAARPFYVATPVSRHRVARRRHIRTRRREVVGVDDEVLSGDAVATGGPVAGEAALLAALDAPRTGRMRDIVSTIQAEQDEAIRADLGGVLVIQGGPGTGKTAVALHRAAYLLFTHRQVLDRRGVLVVAPSTTFVDYISHVLPSLAETGVLARTLGQLYPGVTATGAEEPAAAVLKGDARMAAVVAAAVADRQRVPDEDAELRLDDGQVVRLPVATLREARDAARASGFPHNRARARFGRAVAGAAARALADRIGYDPFGFDALGEDDAPGVDNVLEAGDVEELAAGLARDPAVHAFVDGLWPVLTPERLLADLFATPARLGAAAGDLTPGERALLARPAASPWTPADVPLLDEAAELLGDPPAPAAPAADEDAVGEVGYAQGVLDVAAGSRSFDLEAGELSLQAGDLLDAAALAARHAVADTRTAAERAAADRRWVFGHVVVDEAQELSAMAWRLIMRRCPTRSVTVAGDLAQRSLAAGTDSWEAVLAPHAGDRWRLVELTIGYRTPAEIMALAAALLRHIDARLKAPEAVRSSGVRPWARQVPAGRLGAELLAVLRAALAADEEGSVAAIVPPSLAADLRSAVAPVLGERASLLTPVEAKGLEFDTVVVVEPALVEAAGDLYVALTRPTQRLGILHSAGLPAGVETRLLDVLA